ncbi:four helix bundle protein [Myxosarcina sp. GI1]|uniref:four helix bundle protein n=1 Tax=Myxosarcina sp. GI1 TaxID=1541065 RepID=UPI00056A08C9|nr:four helix bundle protein [Myxosarcina sp. GI1]
MIDNISIQQRTKHFAVRVIKAYIELSKKHFDDAAKILSKQFLSSGTSIGANCAEARFAQSRADFLSKYLIALKETCECKYWIEIMIESNIVLKNKFNMMLPELEQIIRILVSTTKKLKENK